MPIYEYGCSRCGRRFEELVRRPAEEKVACPACGSARVERRPSTFAVSGAKTEDAAPTACCGLSEPCSDPKRCCER